MEEEEGAAKAVRRRGKCQRSEVWSAEAAAVAAAATRANTRLR